MDEKRVYITMYIKFAQKVLSLLSLKYASQKSVETYLYMFLYFGLGLRRNVTTLSLSQFDAKNLRFYPRPYAIYNDSPLYMIVPRHLVDIIVLYTRRFKIGLDQPLFRDIERPSVYERKIFEITGILPQDLVNACIATMIEYSKNPKQVARLLYLNKVYLDFIVRKLGFKLTNDFKLMTADGRILEPSPEVLHPFLYLAKKTKQQQEQGAGSLA
ncbi:hypothetical protein ATV_gp58 [Bicaudavirus pozzuoliense]|uniref:Uncharacterized protein ORF213 n=2 Tax=Acidianus two-tailed virus TaxID=315953 RepID=Y213_ATV|nr:hypothetical protein ATV_gp58 [Acidianus two-tailed virus]Q3V4Q7.1 RecName: Full=Uncharacterized protein ORF213 [Acidianus two-tailed virus]AON96534.1 hypothetical protein [Acidianus two-tailed phage variant 1]CAI59907.1 hypothetical protein [Acidianus two-tailed virus]